MVADLIQKVKSFCKVNQSDLFIAVIIFLVGLIGFGLGKLSVVWPEKEAINITNVLENSAASTEELETHNNPQNTAAVSFTGKYVGSKTGSSYHLPWCPGAQKIKDANKIWFQSKEEAEAKGYKPAGNCPGL